MCKINKISLQCQSIANKIGSKYTGRNVIYSIKNFITFFLLCVVNFRNHFWFY